MNIPKKPKLVRTRNYLFTCGHVFGFPINKKPGKLCPYCIMQGRIIFRYMLKYKKKKDKQRIELFNQIFLNNTNTSSYNNVDGIVKNYL
jgi:hypothetical protein